MMSAIMHTCSFFQIIGINPKLPKLTEPIHDWVIKNEFKEYEKIVQDPVVMYTCFFCYQFICKTILGGRKNHGPRKIPVMS